MAPVCAPAMSGSGSGKAERRPAWTGRAQPSGALAAARRGRGRLQWSARRATRASHSGRVDRVPIALVGECHLEIEHPAASARALRIAILDVAAVLAMDRDARGPRIERERPRARDQQVAAARLAQDGDVIDQRSARSESEVRTSLDAGVETLLLDVPFGLEHVQDGRVRAVRHSQRFRCCAVWMSWFRRARIAAAFPLPSSERRVSACEHRFPLRLLDHARSTPCASTKRRSRRFTSPSGVHHVGVVHRRAPHAGRCPAACPGCG